MKNSNLAEKPCPLFCISIFMQSPVSKQHITVKIHTHTVQVNFVIMKRLPMACKFILLREPHNSNQFYIKNAKCKRTF